MWRTLVKSMKNIKMSLLNWNHSIQNTSMVGPFNNYHTDIVSFVYVCFYIHERYCEARLFNVVNAYCMAFDN